jgi:hypothetical protein
VNSDSKVGSPSFAIQQHQWTVYCTVKPNHSMNNNILPLPSYPNMHLYISGLNRSLDKLKVQTQGLLSVYNFPPLTWERLFWIWQCEFAVHFFSPSHRTCSSGQTITLRAVAPRVPENTQNGDAFRLHERKILTSARTLHAYWMRLLVYSYSVILLKCSPIVFLAGDDNFYSLFHIYLCDATSTLRDETPVWP